MIFEKKNIKKIPDLFVTNFHNFYITPLGLPHGSFLTIWHQQEYKRLIFVPLVHGPFSSFSPLVTLPC